MHEINAAAEAITAAADPEANIIVGASINPDLDGEVIITVVATGFDESYFSAQEAQAVTSAPSPVTSVVSDTKEEEDPRQLSAPSEAAR